jgi:hypothetical protein
MMRRFAFLLPLTLLACDRPGPPPTVSTAAPSATPPRSVITTATPTTTAAPTADLCAEKCTGKVTQDLIQALSDAARRSRACYEKALASDPSLAGKLAIAVRLDRNGKLCSVEIARADAQLSAVAACTKRAFENAGSFPAPEGGCMSAEVPIVYVPQVRDGGRD